MALKNFICLVILGQLESFRNYKDFNFIFPKILAVIYSFTKVKIFLIPLVLKLQNILGNFCFSEQIFYRKQSLGAPEYWPYYSCLNLREISRSISEKEFLDQCIFTTGRYCWRSCILQRHTLVFHSTTGKYCSVAFIWLVELSHRTDFIHKLNFFVQHNKGTHFLVSETQV